LRSEQIVAPPLCSCDFSGKPFWLMLTRRSMPSTEVEQTGAPKPSSPATPPPFPDRLWRFAIAHTVWGDLFNRPVCGVVSLGNVRE